jgi:uncharacterized protein DUF3297
VTGPRDYISVRAGRNRPGSPSATVDVAFDGRASYLWGSIPANRVVVIPMSDNLPDRLSSDPRSPFYDAALLERGVGIRFNGAEKTNVEEYCVSEGWIRVPAGNAKDRYGNPLTIKLKGEVVPYLREGA